MSTAVRVRCPLLGFGLWKPSQKTVSLATCNKQRSLHKPLNFQQSRVQKLPRSAGVAGDAYPMEPHIEGDLSEVLKQLHPALVAEIEELLFAPVDSNSEIE